MTRMLLLALAFTAGLALPAAAQSFNAQEQAEIRAVVRDYLVNNPDVLEDALESLQARTTAERERQITNDTRDFSIGPADAPIVMVEFFDYRCPYCHAAMQWVENVVRTRRDVRVVFKELPILGPQSVEASRAALAAQPQGKYMAFHRALMGFRGDLTSERIDQLARSAGINVQQMRARMNSPEITRHLEENRGLAVDSGANATPAFFINGRWVHGFGESNEAEAALRQAAADVRTRRATR